MKKIALTFLFGALLGFQAEASKARVLSLQDSNSLSADVQDIFERPSRLSEIKDLATFEFGTSNSPYAGSVATNYSTSLLARPAGDITAYNANAEGGFIRSFKSSKLAFYVGRQDPLNTAILLRTGATSKQAVMNNPFSVVFASTLSSGLSYGVGALYANSSDANYTTAPTRIEKGLTILSGGVQKDAWDANLNLILNSKVGISSGNSTSGKTGGKLRGAYNFSMLKLSATLTTGGAKVANAVGTAVSDWDVQGANISVETKTKLDQGFFFYGAGYDMFSMRNGTTSKTVTWSGVPLIFGFETDVATWMALRASVSQPVVFNQVKDESATPAYDDSNQPETKIAAGAGFKFGKLNADIVLTASNSASGSVGLAAIGSMMSLTYNF